MAKVNKTVSVEGETWEFVAKEVGYGNMSEFINQAVAAEAKRRGLCGGVLNVFSPASEEAPPAETPEQTWQRIKGTVEFIRGCLEAGQEETPQLTFDDLVFWDDWAASCKMTKQELKRWVVGEFKEIEIKANIEKRD